MSLDDLEKKLYEPDSGVEKITHEESRFDPLKASDDKLESLKGEKKWEDNKSSEGVDVKKIFKIGLITLGSIALAALLVVGFVKFRQSAFDVERVSVKMEGPSQVSGSEESSYRIILKNDNRAELNNAKVLLNYPENFKPREDQNLKIDNPGNSRIMLGTVEGHSEKEIKIVGSFLAAKDSVVYINLTMEYTPSSFSLAFQSKGQLGINIGSSPIFLDVEAPSGAADGNKIDYVVGFRNTSGNYLDGIRVKVDYPEGFSFLSSNPASSEGSNIWYIGSMAPDQDGKIIITGTVSGLTEEIKSVKAYLGYSGGSGEFAIYNQKEKLTRISPASLSISQTINNISDLSVDAGEVLNYEIEYKNNGDVSMRDAIITEEIDSRILDFSKLSLKNGSYDASKKMITWRASEIEGLENIAPGEGGKISFTIPVLERIPVENKNDKNFTITSVARIDSPSISSPIGSNRIAASSTVNLKLDSKVVLEVKGYYNDAVIQNSGPLPPQAGQETSFTMHWKIINVSNDISGLKVSSSLPSGVKWTGKTSPDSESITFNERTNQIEWNVGNLVAGTGILDLPKEASFQISVIPQVNQIGKELILLNPSVLTAKDSFTGADVKVEIGQKDNKIPEDPIAAGKYKIVN